MHDAKIERPYALTQSRVHELQVELADPSAGLEPVAVPFGRVAAILRRHVWIIILTFVIGVGGTVVIVKGMAKQYTADASIIIEPQRTQVSDLQAISSDSEDVASLMRTQIGILSSPALALGVVKSLNLAANPEFTPGKGGVVSRLKGLIQTYGQKFGLVAAQPTQTPTMDQDENIAAGMLGGKISFANDAQSRLLTVAVTTHDPVLSARIANEVAKQFLDFKVQEKFSAMQRAHDWLQGQVGSLAAEVRADDEAVEQYRLTHGLGEQVADTTGNNVAGTPTVNHQQLDAISQQLVDVSRDLAEKQGELAQAQAALSGGTSTNNLPAVLASPLIAQLLSEQSAVAGREAELAASEGANNPELLSVQAQLARLQTRTQQQMAHVAGSLAVQVAAGQVQQRALQQQMEALRGSVSGENSAEVGLNTLETQASATRKIYESFLTRAAQLANVAGIQEPDASLVSSAEPPIGPSGPQSTRLMAIAALLSLGLGIGIACLMERMRSGFSLPEQVESTLGLPLLAMIPKIRHTKFLGHRKGKSDIAMAASLDRLRGQMRLLGGQRPRLVMVTSALPQEGKSVFAVELARNMAAVGWRVLLLECDFCRPSLGAYLGLPPGPGLCEILSGKSLGDTRNLVRNPGRNLDVILAGKNESDSQEMLASQRMQALLKDVRAQYDLVIMDTPPVLPVADALVLGQQADTTLLVVRWEKTQRAAVSDAARLLRGSGSSVMGVVMTRVDVGTAAISGGRMSYAFSHYDGYRPKRA
jgi:succinoglycan biosynthesis transport protein ExoP